MELVKREAGLAAWPHILPPALLASLPFPDRWTEAISSPEVRVTVLVADAGGQLVGFAVARPSGDEDAAPDIGELDGFYTSPGVWGRGVGRALLAVVVTTLRASGFRHATLWTAALNHRPRRIYEAAGWQTDGAERVRRLGGVDFVELRYRTLMRSVEAPS
jgi:GNAT superfamily N-acetyltransferase